MKNRSLLLLWVVLGAAGNARAAVRKCEVDTEVCPLGEHLHCVSYGWCGDQCEDSCDGSPREPQVCSPTPENNFCGQW